MDHPVYISYESRLVHHGGPCKQILKNFVRPPNNLSAANNANTTTNRQTYLLGSLRRFLFHFQDHFNHVVYVRLCVCAARDRHPAGEEGRRLWSAIGRNRPAGARRILEGISLRIGDLGHQIQSGLKVRLGFARKSGDEVAGQCNVGTRRCRQARSGEYSFRRYACDSSP